MATDTTSAAPSDREQFEAYARDRGYRLDRSTGGGYLYGQAAIAWRAWQAARAQPAQPAVVEPLTDEQHDNLMRGRSTLDYGRAVEAAHGITRHKPANQQNVPKPTA